MTRAFPVVRLERQPHRDAVERLRTAYRRLSQAQPNPCSQAVEEVKDGNDSGIVCPRLHAPTGAGSDH